MGQVGGAQVRRPAERLTARRQSNGQVNGMGSQAKVLQATFIEGSHYNEEMKFADPAVNSASDPDKLLTTSNAFPNLSSCINVLMIQRRYAHPKLVASEIAPSSEIK